MNNYLPSPMNNYPPLINNYTQPPLIQSPIHHFNTVADSILSPMNPYAPPIINNPYQPPINPYPNVPYNSSVHDDKDMILQLKDTLLQQQELQTTKLINQQLSVYINLIC